MQDSETAGAAPIEIKAIVVVFFHADDGSGHMEGEFKHWLTRYGFSRKFPFPQGDFDIYMNDIGVLGFVAGIGVNTATAAVMGLGMDSRFDLSKAYWLVAGVGGASPQVMTIGGVAIARYVVDADKKHVIDSREMPQGWMYGASPYGNTAEEFPVPARNDYRSVFRLNSRLADWALQKTRNIELANFVSGEVRNHCSRFKHDAAARERPKVIFGDVLSGDNFWHGRILHEWATKWVDYWTEGRGQFSICSCEDAGILTALTLLDKAGKVDFDRIIVTRAASNFVCQWDGATAGQSMATEDIVELTGLSTALESAFAVGSCLVDELVGDWNTDENVLS